MTGAENGAREQAAYAVKDELTRHGFTLKKEWIATFDARTRDSHAAADGQQVEIDDPFIVGGAKLMYPGDPSGPAREVYNCRCSRRDIVGGFDEVEPVYRRDQMGGQLISDMSYKEWAAAKEQELGKGSIDKLRKMSYNESTDRRQYESYRSTLGSDAPQSFPEFQRIKYYEPEKWSGLKVAKRQTTVVNNAPCETTPKKFTGYLLKPGAKHSQDFFDVGYTENNTLLLRYDIARQFDMEKAVDKVANTNGSEQFNVYMQLGVSKTRWFLTGWQIDSPGDKPRIITGFRKRPTDD